MARKRKREKQEKIKEKSAKLKAKKRTHSKEERIEELEEELRKTKYNKRTQHAIGLLKAKIARLKEQEEKKASSGKKGLGYSVKKTGDATVVLVGYPSVGKSTLLNALTNADSKTASYAFTTLNCIPGTMIYNSAKIQILDIPGLVSGAAKGAGRGREVISVVRNADLVMVMIDVFEPQQLDIIKKELHNAGLRLNQERPYVKITKHAKGGIIVSASKKLSYLDEKMIKDILAEFKFNNATILIRDDITVGQLIDCIEDNKIYIPMIAVLNKIDLANQKQL